MTDAAVRLSLRDLLDRNPEVDAPLLRSSAGWKPTRMPKIDWQVGDEVWWNHTQIVRNSFVTSHGATEADLEIPKAEHERSMIHSIETIARCGQRSEGKSYVETGGVTFFLGRDYEPGDEITLRFLRDPEWRSWDRGSSVQHDLLCEFAVEVKPHP